MKIVAAIFFSTMIIAIIIMLCGIIIGGAQLLLYYLGLPLTSLIGFIWLVLVIAIYFLFKEDQRLSKEGF